jgi:hypothetical protein
MDITIIWNFEEINESLQVNLYKLFTSNNNFAYHICLEPYFFENPWSASLEGLKVLVVHPFEKSIRSQYQKRRMIWSNRNILPNFCLLTYKSFSNFGISPHSNWVETLETMKKSISDMDFDIALIGCGAYGNPLCSFIKETLKKSSIYIGGSLQIMFGIKGCRWDSNEEISKFYNEHWVYPLEEETPSNHKQIEGGAYWKP